MNTPITDFVKKYADSGISRFHMPGHKGKILSGSEQNDITEIDGADALYSAEGIIAKSMKNASELFGTAATFYSTEGSTLAIKTMLATATDGIQNPRILAARNVHKAFVYAAALLGVEVEWMYGEANSICECAITSEILKNALKGSVGRIDAVYVTSPDYLGNILDISALSSVCREFGVPLLVDNAHGAYLKFLNPSQHPIDLGAAMSADSAHKTLPVLTGGAYLHVSNLYPEYAQTAYKKMSIFASTSPSYLILQSLDSCNKYLSEGYSEKLAECVQRFKKIKAKILEKGFRLRGTEPLKITIDTLSGGYAGEEFADILRRNKIEPEFCDENFVVLMVTAENTEFDLEKLESVIEGVCLKTSVKNEGIFLPKPERVMSIRSAVLSQSVTVAVENSVGKICAAPVVSCPPAIPVTVSGERITAEAVELMQKYKIKKIDIIKGTN